MSAFIRIRQAVAEPSAEVVEFNGSVDGFFDAMKREISADVAEAVPLGGSGVYMLVDEEAYLKLDHPGQESVNRLATAMLNWGRHAAPHFILGDAVVCRMASDADGERHFAPFTGDDAERVVGRLRSLGVFACAAEMAVPPVLPIPGFAVSFG